MKMILIFSFKSSGSGVGVEDLLDFPTLAGTAEATTVAACVTNSTSASLLSGVVSSGSNMKISDNNFKKESLVHSWGWDKRL